MSHLMYSLSSLVSLGLLLMSVLASFLSSSSIEIWLLMEFNMMIFLFWLYLTEVNYLVKGQVSILYFLIQSVSSLNLFWALILFKVGHLFISKLAFLFLFLKLGLFPFQSWVVMMGQSLSKLVFGVLMVIQKIIPFLLMRLSLQVSFSLLLLNLVFSLVLAYTEISVVNILVYSSLFNSVWVIMAFHLDPLTGFFYYGIYSVLFLGALSCLVAPLKNNITMALISMNKASQCFLILMVFSLAGFPATLGFYGKLIVALLLIEKLPLLLLSLVVTSALFLYFYSNLFLQALVSAKGVLMTKSPNMKLVTFLVTLNLIPLVCFLL